MPDSLTKVRVGVPGAPGTGVTSAEKASFVTLTAANVFTNTNEVRTSNAAAVIASSGATTADRTQVIDTLNKEVELWNGAKLRGFSNTGSTETWSVDSATGAAQFDGNVTADGGRFIGEQLWWEIEIDGGGVAITTGTKRRIMIPYNCTITSDGTSIWNVTADQSGSISLDLWVDTYTNYPPTNADRISGTVGSNNPRLSGSTKSQSNSTTNWTLTLAKGSYLFVDVNSASTVQFVTLGLHVKKT